MLTKLGTALLQQNELEASDSLLQRAIQINRQTLGSRNPWVALDLETQGRIRAKQGRYARAVALYRRALSINRERYPENHIYIAYGRMYLGRALLKRTGTGRPSRTSQRAWRFSSGRRRRTKPTEYGPIWPISTPNGESPKRPPDIGPKIGTVRTLHARQRASRSEGRGPVQ